MKVEKKPESFSILGLPTGSYHKIWRFGIFFGFEIWRIWAIFSMKDHFV
jgi:hypothetical protein